MLRPSIVPTVLAALAVSAAVPAAACDLTIEQGWVRTAPPGAPVMAGYGVLKAEGAAAVALGTMTSPQFGAVELHETREQDGVARMRRVDAAEVPGRGELRLEPSGGHLMLMRPMKPLAAGDQVELRVAGCTFTLDVRDDAAGADQGHHHHH
ncbi:copper chaperone PCu(A)C [Dokdonella sp. MW10]|uniref:copper chaperone PCu(A)C n=1 Tax=Dokdonella sp. MW10 TaxID=2992926 RepID=UPI003F80BB60